MLPPRLRRNLEAADDQRRQHHREIERRRHSRVRQQGRLEPAQQPGVLLRSIAPRLPFVADLCAVRRGHELLVLDRSARTGQFDMVHGYDHNAVDTPRSVLLQEIQHDPGLKYVPGSGWSSLPTFNLGGRRHAAQVAASLEYFAAMDRLVFFNSCGGGLHYYNPATNSWTTQTVSGIPDGGIHTLSASSGHGFYHFAAGNRPTPFSA